MALAAVKHSIPVVNYVTNHGHFRFSVHSCSAATRHLVRTDAAKRYLQTERGYRDESIEMVGYLINAPHVEGRRDEGPRYQATARPHFVLVSNRGGVEYLTVLEHLIHHSLGPSGTFVGLNDPVLCKAATSVVDRAGASSWRIVEKLGHDEFIKMLSERNNTEMVALVSKASPNSIMEAVYMGIPLFLFRSGLPMEDWSCEFVTSERFGDVADDAVGVCRAIDAALAGDPRLRAFSMREHRYAKDHLDQGAVVNRIVEALGIVAPAGATIAQRNAPENTLQ